MKILYRAATTDDVETLTELSLLLYNNHKYNELFDSIKNDLNNPKMAMFIACDEEKAVGFAHVSLRNDYVEGTNGGLIGYLEGIYVRDNYRGNSIAKKLALICEDWTRKKGCREFASDCELENSDSLSFHLKIGFSEANRIICFTKKL